MSYNGGYCPHGKMWASRCDKCGPGAYEEEEKKMTDKPEKCKHGIPDYAPCFDCAMEVQQPVAPPSSNKYVKTIRGDVKGNGAPMEIDVYSVLQAFNVTNPGLQHAIKKLLMPGVRGSKGVIQDMDEAIEAIKRAKILEETK